MSKSMTVPVLVSRLLALLDSTARLAEQLPAEALFERLPGHERTMIPDEDLWQVELEALDGSHFEVNSQLLVAAPR